MMRARRSRSSPPRTSSGAARQGTEFDGGALLLVREGRPGDPPETASAMSRRIGKPVPEVYSADLSEFVFAAGV